MFDKAIDILYSAKQDGIDIVLNEEELHVKLPKNRSFNKDLLGEIKGNKQQIIDFLKSSSRVNGDYIRIEKFDRKAIRSIPASFSQQRLWFIDQLEGSTNYHIPAVLRLKGQVHVEALEFALKTVLQRHEVLRTVLKDEDGQVFQHILDSADWRLEFINDNKYNDQVLLSKLVGEFQMQPFDLSSDYMLRATLVTISSDEHLLLVNMHHIASDGWSMSVLVKEVVELYSSFTENRSPRLETLQLQYADFSVWQLNHLKGEVLDRKLGYWKKKLEGLEPLSLPTDYSLNGGQLQGGAYKLTVDKKLAEELQSLSQDKGTTLFMTLLTAFKVLLYNYTNQEDICVGTPIAGRQQPEIASLIGNFVNTLALRSHISPDATFETLLQQVRATTLEAYQNQEVPFERIVEILPVERSAGKSPVFQVVFAVQNTPEVPVIQLGNLQLLNNNSSSYNSTKFDLTVTVSEAADGLNIGIDYGANLFAADTIERLATNFKELLKSIVTQPQKEIKFLRVLSVEEEHKLLVEFSSKEIAYPRQKTIIDLFEEQVLLSPGSTALAFGSHELTYRELNELSNKLAHYLRSKGIREETLVPICMDRSLELIVGILGILKAGGAYVPIDQKYPVARIAYMLDDTFADLIVCSKSTINKLEEAGGRNFLALDSDWETISAFSSENLHVPLTPASLAYVIYTSGSTGNPKGVMVEHKGVVSLVKGVDYASLTNKEVLLSINSPSFDATTFEYWGMLLNGGQLVVYRESNLLDNEALKEEIRRRGVSVMLFTTSWFNQLVETDIEVFEGLETLIVGGEKLSEQHVQKFRIAKPSIHIINMYGPTENSNFSTNYTIKETIIGRPVPIGRAINNRTAYILNSAGGLAPIGVSGEIHVSGPGLARGYLNKAELTNDKFVPNVYSKGSEQRMYKTGDFGRWLSDGNIEYVGRVDDQVKIRGFRIELGEIESAILQSEFVTNAVVLAVKDKEGQKRLAGYIVVEKEKFDKAAFTAGLHSRLPDFMVPTLWVELESFPITPNGKIDKKALPDPDLNLQFNQEYVAPRNEVEVRLAQIWEQVLRVDKVGIFDNFFELGGHSLLALRLVSAMQREFSVSIPIKEVFTNPTIAALSVPITNSAKLSSVPTIKKIAPRPQIIPTSFSQERLWFMDQLEGSLEYNIPATLRLIGQLNISALERSLSAIVDRHEVLRTVFREQGGQPYQFIKE
ncbi:amino acid adenylation domain-containing protein, partial [Segetibacter sp.]|uniref:non-ribosomal peptide synthetase n=1 Tax=Segetibacter sp. TaxID=2231182 RepID=UPI0026070C0A